MLKQKPYLKVLMFISVLLLPASVLGNGATVYPGHACHPGSWNDSCIVCAHYNVGVRNACATDQALLCPVLTDPENYSTLNQVGIYMDSTTGSSCVLSRIKYNGTSGAHYAPDTTAATYMTWSTDRDLYDGVAQYVYAIGCQLDPYNYVYSYYSNLKN
jgi:hypothetical protein